MKKFTVTLATYDTDNPCTAQVDIEAVNAKRANYIAEFDTDHSTLEWTDSLGNDVEWDDVDGSITVAEGTEETGA